MTRQMTLRAIAGLAAGLGLGLTLSLDWKRPISAQAQTSSQSQNYSPYADWRYPIRVYWRDQSLFTSHSLDADLVGDRLTPTEVARGAAYAARH